MKIAISGKGGVGKSTVAASLALLLAREGGRVLALDADPDANLAAALGVPPGAALKPIADEIALIEERTGAKVNEYGRVFKLNPEGSDVAEKLAYTHEGVDLLVLGGAGKGGGGCACPENSFIKALVSDLVLYKNETLVMDMEAGIEHLGRGTASGVDVMIVVVEPGRRSLDCAESVMRMSRDIGLTRFLVVANKVTDKADRDFIAGAFPGTQISAYLPYAESIRLADRDGRSALAGMGSGERAEMLKLIEQIRKREFK